MAKRMLDTTFQIIKSAMRADNTLSPTERSSIMTTIRKPQSQASTAVEPKAAKIVRRREAAALIGRSLRFIDSLESTGVLQKVRIPGRQRALGFREADIVALINSQ
jgi:hypothetical protein